MILDITFGMILFCIRIKKGVDGIIRRCMPKIEQQSIIKDSHASPYGGHHAGQRTAANLYYNLVFIGQIYLTIVLNL
jgi:hypothetical protein